MGLMMSVLVFSIGVLEALSCAEHIRQSYLPLEMHRKRRRLVLDRGTGSIRHRETRRSSGFQPDPHAYLRSLAASLPEEESECEELAAIFDAVETRNVHSTHIQEANLLAVSEGLHPRRESCNGSELSTPATVILNVDIEPNAQNCDAFTDDDIPLKDIIETSTNKNIANTETERRTQSLTISTLPNELFESHNNEHRQIVFNISTEETDHSSKSQLANNNQTKTELNDIQNIHINETSSIPIEKEEQLLITKEFEGEHSVGKYEVDDKIGKPSSEIERRGLISDKGAVSEDCAEIGKDVARTSEKVLHPGGEREEPTIRDTLPASTMGRDTTLAPNQLPQQHTIIKNKDNLDNIPKYNTDEKELNHLDTKNVIHEGTQKTIFQEVANKVSEWLGFTGDQSPEQVAYISEMIESSEKVSKKEEQINKISDCNVGQHLTSNTSEMDTEPKSESRPLPLQLIDEIKSDSNENINPCSSVKDTNSRRNSFKSVLQDITSDIQNIGCGASDLKETSVSPVKEIKGNLANLVEDIDTLHTSAVNSVNKQSLVNGLSNSMSEKSQFNEEKKNQESIKTNESTVNKNQEQHAEIQKVKGSLEVAEEVQKIVKNRTVDTKSTPASQESPKVVETQTQVIDTTEKSVDIASEKTNDEDKNAKIQSFITNENKDTAYIQRPELSSKDAHKTNEELKVTEGKTLVTNELQETVKMGQSEVKSKEVEWHTEPGVFTKKTNQELEATKDKASFASELQETVHEIEKDTSITNELKKTILTQESEESLKEEEKLTQTVVVTKKTKQSETKPKEVEVHTETSFDTEKSNEGLGTIEEQTSITNEFKNLVPEQQSEAKPKEIETHTETSVDTEKSNEGLGTIEEQSSITNEFKKLVPDQQSETKPEEVEEPTKTLVDTEKTNEGQGTIEEQTSITNEFKKLVPEQQSEAKPKEIETHTETLVDTEKSNEGLGTIEEQSSITNEFKKLVPDQQSEAKPKEIETHTETLVDTEKSNEGLGTIEEQSSITNEFKKLVPDQQSETKPKEVEEPTKTIVVTVKTNEGQGTVEEQTSITNEFKKLVPEQQSEAKPKEIETHTETLVDTEKSNEGLGTIEEQSSITNEFKKLVPEQQSEAKSKEIETHTETLVDTEKSNEGLGTIEEQSSITNEFKKLVPDQQSETKHKEVEEPTETIVVTEKTNEGQGTIEEQTSITNEFKELDPGQQSEAKPKKVEEHTETTVVTEKTNEGLGTIQEQTSITKEFKKLVPENQSEAKPKEIQTHTEETVGTEKSNEGLKATVEQTTVTNEIKKTVSGQHKEVTDKEVERQTNNEQRARPKAKEARQVVRKMTSIDDDVTEVVEAQPSSNWFTRVEDITSPDKAFWLIFSGEYTKAMSKDWHSGHFCCWQCDESLTGQRYVLRDDHPYCIKCYEQVFANTCDECSKVIGIDSKDLSYKDKHWHEACFLCSKCRVSLVDKQFGSKADKIYCGNCYDAQFASRCDGCGQIFRAGTKKMEYKTRQWHEQCFCCCVCKTPIGTKSFIPREQEIYCAGCYEEKFATRCVKCNKIITSGGVTYKNEPWHRECFTCTHCNTSLAGQRFTSRDDKPYCADCFGELFAKRCTACCKPITGIGGTRFISFEDRHWHNDCFICASCRSSLVGRGFITDAEDILCTECAKQKLM